MATIESQRNCAAKTASPAAKHNSVKTKHLPSNAGKAQQFSAENFMEGRQGQGKILPPSAIKLPQEPRPTVPP